MQVYLIECGEHFILFVRELKAYFFVKEHPEYLAAFISGQLQCDQWKDGHRFQYLINSAPFTDHTQDPPKKRIIGKDISEEELLSLFCEPENNAAVIASRAVNQAKPTIHDKHRFRNINSV